MGRRRRRSNTTLMRSKTFLLAVALDVDRNGLVHLQLRKRGWLPRTVSMTSWRACLLSMLPTGRDCNDNYYELLLLTTFFFLLLRDGRLELDARSEGEGRGATASCAAISCSSTSARRPFASAACVSTGFGGWWWGGRGKGGKGGAKHWWWRWRQ